MKNHLLLLCCVPLFAVAGCADEKLVGRPGLSIVDGTKLPPPTRDDLILQRRAYAIGPFDRVAIDVYGVPELSRTVGVDASGTISLPLIGTVDAAGKSPTELSTLLADRLRGKYMRDPQVTVNVDTVSQMVTVEGSVESPGLYPVSGQMTLLRAIASAKGLTEFARTNYVIVFRQVSNQKMAAVYDLRAIRQGIYDDPEIYANDIISVDESGRARAFNTLLSGGALLTAPLVAILQ